MKDQYFGDVNDFRKFGLLRLLIAPKQLRLGICWMLTKPDDRPDGMLRSYLTQPEKYHHRDVELFNWLNQHAGRRQGRRTAPIETSTLLGDAVFQSTILSDDRSQRASYFCECVKRFAGSDLVFFDPDNGMEIRSIQPGRKNSCKYLFWDEACKIFATGSSVLIYQHFPREKRDLYVGRMAGELRQRTGAAAVFVYRTPHVLFLLASQARHAAEFRRQLESICSRWGPEIVATEHSAGRLSRS